MRGKKDPMRGLSIKEIQMERDRHSAADRPEAAGIPGVLER
jgi:hypothetical protein